MVEYNSDTSLQTSQLLLHRIFAWMAGAVGLSGVTALLIAQRATALTPGMAMMLMLGQLVLVMMLSWRISSLSYTTARVLFIAYSVLSGATLSVIFAVYTLPSIANVFFIAAAMFGIMALYGMYTRTNLASYRNILLMGLVGVIIALLVNIFLQSQLFDLGISLVSVLLFCALTAYDIQNIQRLSQHLLARDEDWNKIAIIGALQLYLDFVNLFLSLLRLFGRRRN